MGDTRKRSYQKNKHFYSNEHKRRAAYLENGVKGFFCTCNFQEKNCVREAYNILNEYAGDELEPQTVTLDQNQPQPLEESEPDVTDMLQKQIADIKSKDIKHKRFQSLDTSVQNCIFIQAKIEDPVELGHRIVSDIAKTKVQKTRFLLRLVPIEVTCSVKMADIILAAGKLFDKHFLTEPTTFSIIFNRRYNNSISRENIIKELADLVVSKNSSHKADLKNPKLAVIVEIIKGTCMLSVLPDYFELKKYNIVELCTTKPPENAPNVPNDDLNAAAEQTEQEVAEPEANST